MDVRDQLGQNVQLLRRLRGWSQEDLAAESGLHRTYISGVERGVRNPTVLVVARLAQTLGSTPSALLDPALRPKS